MADLNPLQPPYQNKVADPDGYMDRGWLSYFTNWAGKIIAGAVNVVSGTPGRIVVGGTQTAPTVNIDPAYVASVAQGGTGHNTYALGDMLYASGPSAMARLPGAVDSFPRIMAQTGTGAVSATPAWMTRSELLQVFNVLDYGAMTGGIIDNQTAFNASLSKLVAAGGGTIEVSPGTYYISSWNLNAISRGCVIRGFGPQTILKFGSGAYGLRLDGGCRKVRFENLGLLFPDDVVQDCIQLGTSAGANQAYENAFSGVYIQGNAASVQQNGLVIQNSYINQFYDCKILNFNKNIVFKSEANSNNFYGCSIRSNQTANALLIDAQSGQQNTFYGGDIENATSWISNSGCLGLTFIGVYMEASLDAAVSLTGGYTHFQDNFISEARLSISSGGDFSLVNNRILKTGSSYFLYFTSSTLPNMVIRGNKMEYDNANPTTTGFFARGFLGGFQYFDSTLTTPLGNATTSKYMDVDQERIFDVNTSTLKTFISSNADGISVNGPAAFNGSVSGTAGSFSSTLHAGGDFDVSASKFTVASATGASAQTGDHTITKSNPAIVLNNTGGSSFFPQFDFQHGGVNRAFVYWDEANLSMIIRSDGPSSNGIIALQPGGGATKEFQIDAAGNALIATGGVLKIGGTQVLKAQQAGLGSALASGTAGGTYTSTEQAMITALNAKVAALETIIRAHGLGTT